MNPEYWMAANSVGWLSVGLMVMSPLLRRSRPLRRRTSAREIVSIKKSEPLAPAVAKDLEQADPLQGSLVIGQR
jgi:hypothetical protein